MGEISFVHTSCSSRDIKIITATFLGMGTMKTKSVFWKRSSSTLISAPTIPSTLQPIRQPPQFHLTYRPPSSKKEKLHRLPYRRPLSPPYLKKMSLHLQELPTILQKAPRLVVTIHLAPKKPLPLRRPKLRRRKVPVTHQQQNYRYRHRCQTSLQRFL